MLDVFFNVVLPTFLVVAIATLFQRWKRLPIATLSQTTFYVLSPALAYSVMIKSSISADKSLKIIGSTILAMALISILSLSVTLLFRHSRTMRSAFLLSTLFPNAGNMALPVILLALGPEGLSIAMVIFVTHVVLGWSLGTFVASRSEKKGFSPILQVLKVPAIYGVFAALGTRMIGWELPIALAEPIDLLATAAIPTMLLVLGFQLGNGISLKELPSLGATTMIRLVIAPPLGYLATILVGLEGLPQQAVIIVASMPTGVFTIILGTQFKTNPGFVTNAVVVSTLLSIVSLTIVVTLVKSLLA